MKFQQIAEEGWCTEFAATLNLKWKETFTRGLQNKLKDSAHKQHFKHTSIVSKPCILFHTFVELVVAEDITNEKICTFDLPMEIKIVKSKRKTETLSVETNDPNPEVMFTQIIDPNNKR